MPEHIIKLFNSKTFSPFGVARLLIHLANDFLLRSVAISMPNTDIDRSLIAKFGKFIIVLTTPTKNIETPNRSVKRPRNRETWLERDVNLIKIRNRKSQLSLF